MRYRILLYTDVHFCSGSGSIASTGEDVHIVMEWLEWFRVIIRTISKKVGSVSLEPIR